MSPYLQTLRRKVGHELLLIPSVAGIVLDVARRVLLVRYAERDDVWGLPGGSIDPHERPSDAVVREVWEETALLVRPIRVLGVYGGPEHHVTYANRDEVSYVSTAFECQVIRGELEPDGAEIAQVAYFSESELPTIRLSPIAQVVLPDAFLGPTQTSFQPPTWTPPG
jgi:ADP-ribose pyrophosphatase YjhB (NUDIX family)